METISCAFHGETLDASIPIPSWSSLSEPYSTDSVDNDSDSTQEDDSIQKYNPNASIHRAAILETAARIAKAPKKQILKRKSTWSLANSKKRSSGVNRNKLMHLYECDDTSIDTDFTSNPQRLRGKSVKRFLLPTTLSRLNERPKSVPHIARDWPGSDDENGSDPSLPSMHEHGQYNIDLKLAAVQDSSSDDSSAKTLTEPITGLAMDQCEINRILEALEVDDSCFGDDLFSDENEPLATTPATSLSLTPSVQLTPSLSQSIKKQSGPPSPSSANSPHIPRCSPTIAPFLRQDQPESLRQAKYSSIPRLISALKIPTCFRIAEALRFLKQQESTVMTNTKITIELYTIIVDQSTDNGNLQRFRLADIFFPHQPPYLIGTVRKGASRQINGILQWSRNGEYTASAYQARCIPDGALCRAIITSLPETEDKSRLISSPASSPSTSIQVPIQHVYVETIRQSNWEEIEHVRGIVDPKSMETPKQNLLQKKKGPTVIIASKEDSCMV